jgi:cellulose synthase/poly-beta-1,6-N-acetylglucosamine synthase-like glycosyltransferase
MQTLLQATFWVSVVLVGYVYLLYPMLIWAVSRLRPVAPRSRAASLHPASFSIVLAVHNEAARVTCRIDELVSLISATGLTAEIIVVTDGCSDQTALLARSHTSTLVRVVELAENQGKAFALSRGCEVAKGEILVFADARQRWAADALQRLLRAFARAEIGAVSGELVIESGPGVLAGVSLYWRYEKWLRRNEARVHSTVGLTGSICAVRRELFRPIPRGVLLDDVYWPLQVAMQGWRVVYEEGAIAYDRLPDRPADEFRRKVRTLSGNFQLAALLPQALLPWRNPIWAQLISHKLLRLVVPWLLLLAFVASGLLGGPLYRAAFVAQLLFYGLALVTLAGGPAVRWGLASAAASFVVLNAAAWVAFWVWVLGRAGISWKKVVYDAPLPPD